MHFNQIHFLIDLLGKATHGCDPKILTTSLFFMLLCIFHDILKLNPSGFPEFWLLIVVITNNLCQLLIILIKMVFRSTQIATHVSSQRFQFTSKLAMNHHCSQILYNYIHIINVLLMPFRSTFLMNLLTECLDGMCLAHADAAS